MIRLDEESDRNGAAVKPEPKAHRRPLPSPAGPDLCADCGAPLTPENRTEECVVAHGDEEARLRSVIEHLAKSAQFWMDDSRAAWQKCEARRKSQKQLKARLDVVLRESRAKPTRPCEKDCPICANGWDGLPTNGHWSCMPLEDGAWAKTRSNVLVVNRSGGPVVVRAAKGRELEPEERGEAPLTDRLARTFGAPSTKFLVAWMIAVLCVATSVSVAILAITQPTKRPTAQKRFL